MSLYDWNHDGKKDMADNYIEYQIYKDVTDENDNHSYTPASRSSNGLSTFEAIIGTISGLIIQSVLYLLLGIDINDVPLLVIIILWVVFSIITVAIIHKIRS